MIVQPAPKTVKDVLSVRVPKCFWIPSKGYYISAGNLVKMYKFCKANPGMAVKETISGWWPGTTDDVLNQIRAGIHERI